MVVEDITKAYAAGHVTREEAVARIAAVIRAEPPHTGPEWDDIRPLRATSALRAALFRGRVDEDMVEAVLDAVRDVDG